MFIAAVIWCILTTCSNDCYTTTPYPLHLNTLQYYDLESLTSDTEGRIKSEAVFVYKALRKMSGLRGKEKWGIDIIAMIKPAWMTCERHVACMGKMRNEYKHGTKTYVEKPTVICLRIGGIGGL